MSDEKTITERLGGRKAVGFYAALGCCLLLALLDKAKTEILGLIDTLYLVYVGANVAVKKTEAQKIIETLKSKEEIK